MQHQPLVYLHSMVRRLLRYFLQGIVFTAPISITLFVIWKLVKFADDLVPVKNPGIPYLGDYLPGVGILIILVLLTFVGFLSSSLLFKPLFSSLEKLINRAPLVKIMYTSIRDLFSAFVSDKKKFDVAVLVKMNDSGLQKLGFVTQKDLSKLGIANKVAVYLPHSYNFSGNLFIVSSSNITPINASSADVMKFIVSGGVVNPH